MEGSMLPLVIKRRRPFEVRLTKVQVHRLGPINFVAKLRFLSPRHFREGFEFVLFVVFSRKGIMLSACLHTPCSANESPWPRS